MADTYAGSPYSPVVGFVFVFNLIVGTGALAMPRAFAEAGWFNSLVLICCLAFTSYVTATFVIETMAIANGFLAYEARLQPSEPQAAITEVEPSPQQTAQIAKTDDDGANNVISSAEDNPLLRDHIPALNDDEPLDITSDVFEIKERVELGKMAAMFYNWVGLIAFYCCMAIYLYGDLAIYAAAVPKSIRNVACTYVHKETHLLWQSINTTKASTSCDPNLTDIDPCWPSHPHLTRGHAYRIFLAVFAVCLGPFVFFNVQKTAILQYVTSAMRWLAFSMMVTLCIIQLSRGHGSGSPQVALFNGIPTLFGVCVYSFMCHHSLPSLVTPINNKSRIFALFTGDYALIWSFYALLSFTGVFTFSNLQDIYTLNFLCDTSTHPITNIKVIEYFLALFPVFTLSTNFPIIAISLRNNIKTLFHREGKPPHHWLVDMILFPLATICPPIAIAFFTDNVEVLVSITGSYAGASIQYFIPIGLVFFARRRKSNHIALAGIRNHYTSPFRHMFWLIIVFAWALIAVIFVTANHILQRK